MFDANDRVVAAPDARRSVLYKLTKDVVKAVKIKNSLSGTKQQVLEKAAKMNEKRQFAMPTDKKANYTDHMIFGQYHCFTTAVQRHFTLLHRAMQTASEKQVQSVLSMSERICITAMHFSISYPDASLHLRR